MTSKSLRRLATDHSRLHKDGLPPNYLFDPSKEDSFSDLTTLSVLLTGAEGTPFSQGLFALDLKLPPTYPQTAPTAFFRTKIFHPNVDPSTGAICVDTLKRDWKPELTLRDVLITISCLLVFPNAASALNAEAGRLLEEDFGEFERKARLWARMHAAVPANLKEAVEEARKRGEGEKNGLKEEAKTSRGKKRREIAGGEEGGVFVREDGQARRAQTSSVENASSMTAAVPPFSTPDVFASKTGGSAPTGLNFGIGLGLAFKADSKTSMADSSILMDLDNTPTQQPPPPPGRRRIKTFSVEQHQNQAGTSTTTISSFSTVLSTPTPDQTSTFQSSTSNITTPRAPSPKRVRLTPDHGPEDRQRGPTKAKMKMRAKEELDPSVSWITWFKAGPLSPPLSKRDRLARDKNEYRRLKAVDFDIKRYNRGISGPRTGIERL